jgi:hypothetical protein
MAMSFVERVKNEINQRRIPTQTGGGQNMMDASYNPLCLDLSTKIPLLDGRTLSLSELISEFEEGKENWAYSCDPVTGKVVPGLINWAGVTRKDTESIELTFDNGKTLICTPDHKIMTINAYIFSWDQYGIESIIPITTNAYLYLSGTPFRAIASGEFIEEQIYNWTYSDEQRAKESWSDENNPYAALPRMVMLTYQLPDSIREIAMKGEFNECDLNVFFSAKMRRTATTVSGGTVNFYVINKVV